jgi:hypothetical protein
MMSNEYLNEVDEVTKQCDEESKGKPMLTYVLIVIVVVLLLIVILRMYGGDDYAAYFTGIFPTRSDIGADGFDLQKEVDSLAEKQYTNFGTA